MQEKKPYDEKQLLRRIAAGDSIAFAEVFDKHRMRIFFLAWKLLKSNTAAEDALQEIFTVVWVQRDKLATIENFNAYLNTVTRNHLFNRLRKKLNEEKFLRETLTIRSTSSDTVADEVFWRQLEAELMTALRQLPPKQRQVFELSRLDGCRHDEIARRMGISKETVKKHIMEAMRNIRVYFDRSGLHPLLPVLICLFVYFF